MLKSTLLLISLFASVGCANVGTADTLTGTWTNTSCYGVAMMPDDVQSCSLTLTFAASLDVTLSDSRLTRAANLTYPRCTTVRRVTGQRYSTTPDTVVAIAGTGTATIERTNCINPVDNSAAAPDSSASIMNGSYSYRVNGNTLTISAGPLAGMYTR